MAMAGVGNLLSASEASAQEANAREYYELRLYHLRRGPKTELFDHLYRDAAIPAYHRAGVKKVGVFNVAVGPDSPTMYVLLVHPSAESVALTQDRLAADQEYQKIGAPFINAPATDPSFIRAESCLMRAFQAMPNLDASRPDGSGKGRLFELRTYESHSKKANRKKIEMFEKGEIDIFRKNELHPIFFGETLIGTRLPNLTYMLAFEDQKAHDKAWAAFVADPAWQELRSRPGYADAEIVSNISNVFLRPTGYSEIQ